MHWSHCSLRLGTKGLNVPIRQVSFHQSAESVGLKTEVDRALEFVRVRLPTRFRTSPNGNKGYNCGDYPKIVDWSLGIHAPMARQQDIITYRFITCHSTLLRLLPAAVYRDSLEGVIDCWSCALLSYLQFKISRVLWVGMQMTNYESSIPWARRGVLSRGNGEGQMLECIVWFRTRTW